QDRRSRPGEAIGVRVAAEVLASAGAQRLVVVDPHTVGFEAVCPVPVASLTALPTLADALAGSVGDAGVVVAPDFGATRRAGRLAALLGLPVAIVRKTRAGGAEVAAEEVVGEAGGRQPVIVDDMIATAGTVAAAVRLLRAQDVACRPVVAATHGVFVGDAADRLGGLDLARLLVTDTVPPADQPVAEVCPVAPLLADAIGRLHREEAVEELCVFT
ncbi:MAG TPA: ribose-phosphate diphosphokinase, partial [Acidimicrobiales bacterium]|nr:ribose-phosphate diphosphokinase [Acidimicrobiales bacterium]